MSVPMRGAFVLSLMAAAGVAASASAGTIERVSVASDGTEGGDYSVRFDCCAALSADGHIVAFISQASNLVLVPGDDRGIDLYVRDRRAGTTERVAEDAFGAAISANGQFVAFSSSGAVFVHDRSTRVTRRADVRSDGGQADGGVYEYEEPAISANGRFVAFRSSVANLVAGDTNDQEDVFVHDRQAGKTTRVSLGPNGRQSNASTGSGAPALSTDGRYVAFSSHASNLVRGDANATSDIFVYDRKMRKTVRVSVGPKNRQSNDESYYPSISADGRLVAFTSRATNLVPGDTNGFDDVFIHDRQTGKTKRVSVGTDGAQGDGTSRTSSISDNGRFVAFQSRATNWSSNDTNRCYDAYVHDRRTGVTSLAAGRQIDSCDSDDSESSFGYATHLGAISGNGRVVVFFSGAADLVPDDTNEVIDVFVHTR